MVSFISKKKKKIVYNYNYTLLCDQIISLAILLEKHGENRQCATRAYHSRVRDKVRRNADNRKAKRKLKRTKRTDEILIVLRNLREK